MSEVQDLINYAKSQIGVSENPLGSNKQKYGAMIDQTDWYLYKEGNRTWRHLVNGYDWCGQYVDASFITKFGIEKARKMLFRPKYNNYGAVVKYAFNYFKNAGRGFTKAEHDPQPGDVIYFQNSAGLSHTGIVIETTATTVTTVEGNSGNNSWYVARHTYNKTSSYIYGYGCPDYSGSKPSKYPPVPFDIQALKKVDIRAGVYSDTQIIGKLSKETYETITELGGSSGDYGKLKDHAGYVYLAQPEYIKIFSDQTINGYTVGKQYKVICKDMLNLRKKPSIKGKKLGELASGTTVTCKAVAVEGKNTWMHLDDPSGWICCIYNGEKYVG